MVQHQIIFLFLAAGASSRMRGSDKLLKEIKGVPLLQLILDEALKLNFPVFVTVPAYDTERKLIVSKTNAVMIEVKDADLGMGKSIATGLIETTKSLNFESLAICPSDLPGLSAGALRKLIDFFLKSPEMICRPVKLGKSKFGHPVIFPKKYFEELKMIKGDIGARNIISRNEGSLNRFETADDSYFTDLDTPEDFNNWAKQNS
jgi:CTP:molybdopterin cytidylyltransferase MocA